jgi:hypothetical protein
MRLSDLLGNEVIDVDGKVVGEVSDVRLVQDGPPLAGIDAALRVDALVVGGGGLAVRMGFHRHQVKGPAPLKALFASLERRAHSVPWSAVASWEDGVVRLSCRSSELADLAEAYDE